MIVVTGGAGFIGSAIVWKLNQEGIRDIIIVDHLDESEKWRNLVGLSYLDYYDKREFLELVQTDNFPYSVEICFHMGACSSTTEIDSNYLMENNFKYSQKLGEWAIRNNIRFIYASSAATYGDGSNGYDDDENRLEELRPLNMYGYSKHLFDLWAKRKGYLNEFVGLKFFNVFGPNEYHKGGMRSMILKGYEQVTAKGEIKLFKSYKDEYEDGKQIRDFVYIKDVVDILIRIFRKNNISGIINVGTGIARTWNDLALSIFKSMDIKSNIKYIEMPNKLKKNYQYLTEANTVKINDTFDQLIFSRLEESVNDYIANYLNYINYKYLNL